MPKKNDLGEILNTTEELNKRKEWLSAEVNHVAKLYSDIADLQKRKSGLVNEISASIKSARIELEKEFEEKKESLESRVSVKEKALDKKAKELKELEEKLAKRRGEVTASEELAAKNLSESIQIKNAAVQFDLDSRNQIKSLTRAYDNDLLALELKTKETKKLIASAEIDKKSALEAEENAAKALNLLVSKESYINYVEKEITGRSEKLDLREAAIATKEAEIEKLSHGIKADIEELKKRNDVIEAEALVVVFQREELNKIALAQATESKRLTFIAETQKEKETYIVGQEKLISLQRKDIDLKIKELTDLWERLKDVKV